MFISPAYAQTGGATAGFDFVQLLPLVLIFVVFYLLIIRPQQKKVKDHKTMVDALRRGDRVVTSGGIIGTVVKVTNEPDLSLEIAENVRVKVRRAMIAEVLARTEPAEAKERAERKSNGSAEKADHPEDFYKVLGVTRNASAEEIAAAHAGKAGDAKAEEAFDTLKDPVRRKLYDRLGHEEYVSHLKG